MIPILVVLIVLIMLAAVLVTNNKPCLNVKHQKLTKQ